MGIPPLSYGCKKWKVHTVVLHDSFLSPPSSSPQLYLLFLVAISRAEFSSTELPTAPSLYFSLPLFVPGHGIEQREAPQQMHFCPSSALAHRKNLLTPELIRESPPGVSSSSENTSKSYCSMRAFPPLVLAQQKRA
ncbi:hypothetical protein KP509_19G018700 [Ceratopteris richardii]|uniref:Uncharacterized protein n=1 Tax=Ceratopteris richardii TaxID=49495 RepID=A0A8T2SLZ7_CERRI|nr:hypothetical protein KP509_19G018700 [Ceratopteris richardii]